MLNSPFITDHPHTAALQAVRTGNTDTARDIIAAMSHKERRALHAQLHTLQTLVEHSVLTSARTC